MAKKMVSGRKCVCGMIKAEEMNSPPPLKMTWGKRHFTRLRCACGRIRFKVQDDRKTN